jgi:hypothetical protein
VTSTQQRPTGTTVAAVGTVARLKLTEPLRFYCWPAVAFLLLALLVLAGTAGEWSRFLLVELPGLLLLLAGLEAARGSVYSPRAVVQAVMRARQ